MLANAFAIGRLHQLRVHSPCTSYACLQLLSSGRRWKSGTTTKQGYRVLFFGNDEFAENHLRALFEEKERDNTVISHIELVTSPDRRTGRKLSVLKPMATKVFAEKHNIPVHHTPSTGRTLSGWNPPTPFDLGVVVSFGYFVTPNILKTLPLGAVNVHPSLLPAYRGASPLQYTIMNRDKVGGITVQELDEKAFDAGRILAQEEIDLSTDPPKSYNDLRDRLSSIGVGLLVDTIRNLASRKTNAKVQDMTKVTKAPKIKKELAHVDFEGMEAINIEAIFRAIGHQYPLLTTFAVLPEKGKDSAKVRRINLQLHDLFLPEQSILNSGSCKSAQPGTIAYDAHSHSIHAMCKNGTIIGIKRLKAENKSETSADDFCNGYGLQKDRMGLFERKT
ncbi:formyl transferase [Umbelopsis sp. PMI_123]|nr:formyl transferase [Umbelopsis sp. PMI_123]